MGTDSLSEFDGKADFGCLTIDTRAAQVGVIGLGYVGAFVVATDHDAIDYQTIADHALLIVDTRNVFGRLGLDGETVLKA